MVELAGAAAPALAVGYAALKLAPELGWPLPISLLAASSAGFALAYAAIRAVAPEPRVLDLAAFDLHDIVDQELLLDQVHVPALDELLLDQPLIAIDTGAVAELLLEDALPVPDPESRVVQLFASGRMPTAGQLQQRIARHLANGEPSLPDAVDASDALSAALAELRRSLRQG